MQFDHRSRNVTLWLSDYYSCILFIDDWNIQMILWEKQQIMQSKVAE